MAVRKVYLGARTLSVLTFFFLILAPQASSAFEMTPSYKAWLEENDSSVYFAPVKDYPPFLWTQYGVLFGIGNDYVSYIQEKLQIDFNEREPRTRAQILTAIQTGERSFMATLSETAERNDYLLFTRPYLSVPAIYVGKSGMRSKTGSEIVKEKLRVAIAEDYGTHEYLEKRYPDMLLIPVENNYLVLEAVTSGKTDLGVVNTASLSHLTQENTFSNLKKIGDTGFDVRVSFAVPQSMPELRNIIDDLIESMPEKTRYEIISRWIKDPATLENLAGAGTLLESKQTSKENVYLLGMGALLLLSLGFIGHYLFVRMTPRKDTSGKSEYLP